MSRTLEEALRDWAPPFLMEIPRTSGIPVADVPPLEHDIAAKDIKWVQVGLENPGRRDKFPLNPCFINAHPKVRRLFPDHRTAERDYCRRSLTVEGMFAAGNVGETKV